MDIDKLISFELNVIEKATLKKKTKFKASEVNFRLQACINQINPSSPCE